MVLEKQTPADYTPLCARELHIPMPGPGQVRIQVNCCAVCRTDLHIVEGDLPLHKSPIVPGHMAVGAIDRVGSDCSRLQRGQRVAAAWLASTCGSCEFCRSVRENLCPQATFTGYDVDGGYAQYMLADEAFVDAIPDAFDDQHAAPLLCSGIVGYRSL